MENYPNGVGRGVERGEGGQSKKDRLTEGEGNVQTGAQSLCGPSCFPVWSRPSSDRFLTYEGKKFYRTKKDYGQPRS